MDRRETIKTLLIGGVAGTALLNAGCKGEITEEEVVENQSLYGRRPEETLVDEELMAANSEFTVDELTTIAVLCDIILPATDEAGSATDADVPAFIDFMVKDIPKMALPMKGGLMWINRESLKRYNLEFKDLSNDQQITIVDDIAYPDRAKDEMRPGVLFFNRMRNMTLTGYYTTAMGIRDLGYQGNQANIWDGVPAEVLAKHDVDYDPEWLAKCIDQSKRDVKAEWDEDGNLLT